MSKFHTVLTLIMNDSELVISKPILGEAEGLHQISATITDGHKEFEVWFRSATPMDASSPFAPEAFLAVSLLAAMKIRKPLRIEAPVSAKLLTNLERYQHIISEWYPEFQPITIVPEEIIEEAQIAPPEAPGNTAFYFTAGVDSFYSYLHLREELTHALYIYGIERATLDPDFREFVSRYLHKTTTEMGIEFIEVETNMLGFTERYCKCLPHFHGAGLAGTARLFSDRFRKIVISSTYPMTAISPWGSHPFTDPLWSGDDFEVLHYGTDANRYDKVVTIAENEFARRSLRVCWEKVEGLYNCCRCEKCIRTMVALRIAGKLDQCALFPLPLDLSRIPDFRFFCDGNRWDWEWNYQALRNVDDPELAAVMEQQRQGNLAAKATSEVADHTKLMLASPEWRLLAPKVRNKFWKSFKEIDPQWFSEKLVSSIDGVRDDAFEALWSRRREWLKRKVRQADKKRRQQRWRAALRRIGIGQKSVPTE